MLSLAFSESVVFAIGIIFGAVFGCVAILVLVEGMKPTFCCYVCNSAILRCIWLEYNSCIIKEISLDEQHL